MPALHAPAPLFPVLRIARRLCEGAIDREANVSRAEGAVAAVLAGHLTVPAHCCLALSRAPCPFWLQLLLPGRSEQYPAPAPPRGGASLLLLLLLEPPGLDRGRLHVLDALTAAGLGV